MSRCRNEEGRELDEFRVALLNSTKAYGEGFQDIQQGNGGGEGALVRKQVMTGKESLV